MSAVARQRRRRRAAGPVEQHILPLLKPSRSPSAASLTQSSQVESESISALLTSMSNYQCISENKHDQLGLSFPSDVVATVNSKRESHRADEKDRRDRLRVALAMLADTLLVERAKADEEKPTSAGIKGFVHGAEYSRAKLVELAVEEIRGLRTELDGTKEKLERCETENEATGEMIRSASVALL